MSALIIDGKELASYYNKITKERADNFLKHSGRQPKFSLLVFGDNKDSIRYVNSKAKLSGALGIKAEVHILDHNLDKLEYLKKIDELNKSSDAVLIQLPLPEQLKKYTHEFLEAIDPLKDSDALHLDYTNKLLSACQLDLDNDVLPCTPRGVIFLILHARKILGKDSELANLRATVLGQSDLVGKPTSLLLEKLGVNVHRCDSKTNLQERYECLKNSDLVVSAVGKPLLLKGEDLKPNSIVIDVGINYDDNGRLCGDVDFEAARKVCSAITPVPGGVGPMTLAMLLRNVIILAENQELKCK